ncbi:hypothetical protein AB1Y20_016411 [Prymnesium parvum]|uniref:Mannosyltransferase n=1 Tax=Prymnesium parvum TaxID=97485 RepID=A0AB34IDX5_PRYPA
MHAPSTQSSDSKPHLPVAPFPSPTSVTHAIEDYPSELSLPPRHSSPSRPRFGWLLAAAATLLLLAFIRPPLAPPPPPPPPSSRCTHRFCSSWAPLRCFREPTCRRSAPQEHHTPLLHTLVRWSHNGVSLYLSLLHDIPPGVVLHEGWLGWTAD